MGLDPRTLSEQLSHVYWIGGSPCSGKSSIVDLLANRLGLQPYHADEKMGHRSKMATADRQPTMVRLSSLTWDELWMRPVSVQIREELEYYHEEFPMVLDELLSLPRVRPILAEGAGLLPDCVAEIVVNPSRAIWMVPSYQFQWYHYSRRAFIGEILKQCHDPEQAFRNWMDRDAGFGSEVAAQAEGLGFRVIRVDGQRSLDQIAELVVRSFGLDLPSTP